MLSINKKRNVNVRSLLASAHVRVFNSAAVSSSLQLRWFHHVFTKISENHKRKTAFQEYEKRRKCSEELNKTVVVLGAASAEKARSHICTWQVTCIIYFWYLPKPIPFWTCWLFRTWDSKFPKKSSSIPLNYNI